MKDTETIYFAAGCFWGAQEFFRQFEGVIRTEVGYANGPTPDPTYQEVCSDSGHAETVRIDYDPDVITPSELIDRFLMVVDPFSVNKQGVDVGIQYRSGIYYTKNSQKTAAEEKLAEVSKNSGKKTAVEVLPLENFYTAEEYHQDYLKKNPGGYCHIPKRMMHLEES